MTMYRAPAFAFAPDPVADPVIGLDAHGLVVDVNAEAQRLCAAGAEVHGAHWTSLLAGAGAIRLGRVEAAAGGRRQLLCVRGDWYWLRIGGGPQFWVLQLVPLQRRSSTVDAEPRRSEADDAAAELVCEIDARGVVRHVNAASRPLLGFEPDELVGRQCIDLVVIEDPARVRHEGEMLRARGDVLHRVEGRCRRRDGGYADLRWSVRWLPQAQVFHCIGQDVTALRQAIHALERSRQHYSSLFEHHPDAAFSIDRGGRLTSVNPAAARLFGGAPAELLERSFYDLLAAHSHEAAAAAFARVMDGEPCALELCGQQIDGAQVELQVVAVPIVIDGCVEGLHGIARDVTEKQRVLERLRLLEACVASLNDSVLISELGDSQPLEARICFVNPALERMTGRGAQELLGATPRALLSDQLGTAVFDELRAVLNCAKPYRIELPRRSTDGRALWIEVDVVPVVDAANRPRHLVAVGRDITARKQQEALEAGMARQQRAIADVAVQVLDAETLETALQRLADCARELIGAHEASINIVDALGWGRPLTVTSQSESDRRRVDGMVSADITVCAWMGRQRSMRLSQAERRRQAHPAAAGDGAHGTADGRGWLAAQLLDPHGGTLGMVQLSDKIDGDFSEHDEALLLQLAQLASVAVKNAVLVKALASAEAQYRSIFSNALEGIIRCDGDGVLLAANPSFARLLGHSDLATLLLSLRSLDAVFADPQEWPRIATRLQHESVITGHVTRLRRADGGTIWAMLSLRGSVEDGRLLIEGLIQDVTDRHENEARIHAQNAELEQRVAERTRALSDSEALQRTLMEAAPQIAWVSAADGAVRHFNQRWHEVTGRRAAESLGWGWLAAVHPEDVAGMQTSWREALRHQSRFELAVRIRHRGGAYRHYLYGAHPVFGSDGVLAHWVGISADVTELKHAEAALAQSNRELEAFSYSVSHDLRTPLHAISGFSSALLRRYGDRLDAEALHYMDRISANCALMAKQIADIIELSRVSRSELRSQNVSLSEIARDSIAALQAAAPERKVEVVIQPNMQASGDPALLRLVVDNLLGNAWKFTSRRSDARIEFFAMPQPGEQRFSVRDNGVGFDMAYAGKLFGVFQRLHHVSEFPGTGVGLATVRRIIERHRGEVWVEAAVGQGACFHFSLPRKS